MIYNQQHLEFLSRISDLRDVVEKANGILQEVVKIIDETSLVGHCINESLKELITDMNEILKEEDNNG